jgi:hypothetical protein
VECFGIQEAERFACWRAWRPWIAASSSAVPRRLDGGGGGAAFLRAIMSARIYSDVPVMFCLHRLITVDIGAKRVEISLAKQRLQAWQRKRLFLDSRATKRSEPGRLPRSHKVDIHSMPTPASSSGARMNLRNKVPRFYVSSSPVVADGLCIAALGDDKEGGIFAFDLASGDEKWKWAGTSSQLPTLGLCHNDHSRHMSTNIAAICDARRSAAAVLQGRFFFPRLIAAGLRFKVNSELTMTRTPKAPQNRASTMNRSHPSLHASACWHPCASRSSSQ